MRCGTLRRSSGVPSNWAERRHLTIVFADLVGSTRLSQLLDPEDMRDLLDAYQQRCATVVARHAGHVAQYLGDGILIYFGYPVAHEDDAKRAVDASLELVDALMHAPTPGPAPAVQVRVGVHSGVAVIGAVGVGQRRDHLAIGDTPNIASRVQGAAAPNTVAVSEATKRLIEGFFLFERLDRDVKDVDGEVHVYRVLRRTTAAHAIEAAAQLGLTPLVGRDSELARVQQEWAQVLEGTARGLLLRGEPGIGKSRMLSALRDHTRGTQAHVVEWHCSPDAQHSALHPVANSISRQAGFSDQDSSEERLNKLMNGLRLLNGRTDEALPLWASLLSIPLPEGQLKLELTPQRLRRQTLEMLVELLDQLASEKPVLLAIEDLHWADPSTLELIGIILDRIRHRPLLAVLTARPEFEAPWEDIQAVGVLNLHRLPTNPILSIIMEVCSGRDISSDVALHLAQRSEGVPLFAEELARSASESEVPNALEVQVESTRFISDTTIPSSVRSSLTARMDRLGTGKLVAQVGSTLGRSFTYEMIRAVWQAPEAELLNGLSALSQAHVLGVEGEGNKASYTFRHALIRDAAYGSLLRKVRRQFHAQNARMLLEVFPRIVEAQPELVAQHFVDAGEFASSAPYWIAAGERALQRSANHEAVSHLTRGLEAIEFLPQGESRATAELQVRVLLGPALMAIQGYSHNDVLTNYQRAHALVGQVEESPAGFGILWGLWAQYFVAGQLHAARQPAEQVARMAHASEDPSLLAPAHHALGFVECYTAHYPETVALVEEALDRFDLEREQANMLKFQFSSSLALMNMGATALWMLGKPDQARELAARSRPLAEQLAHPPSMAFAVTASSWFLQLAGQAEQVREVATFVTKLSEEEGFEFWPPLVSVFGGWAEMALGNVAGGAETMLASFRDYRALGGGILRTHGYALLAESLLQAGRIDEALDTVSEALESAAQSGEAHFEPELYRVRGLALWAKGKANPTRTAGVRESLEQALQLARAQRAVWLELRAAINLAELGLSEGSRSDLESLRSVVARISEGEDTREMKRARALLS